jgi:glutaredoxin
VVHPRRGFLLVLGFAGLIGCGKAVPEGGGSLQPVESVGKGPAEAGDAVTPPFPVSGELDGLLLVWFDGEGTHSAGKRSEVPEASRKTVRIDSLAVPPDKRLDPDHVYVADLSAARGDGSYAVRKHSRGWFEAQVEAARPAPPAAVAGSDGVTIYMASWCGACRSAAAYLRSRHVGFEEKDIEKDPQAQSEMLAKARAAGKNPSGVPVIDFKGNIVLGFNQGALDQLIQATQ